MKGGMVGGEGSTVERWLWRSVGWSTVMRMVMLEFCGGGDAVVIRGCDCRGGEGVMCGRSGGDEMMGEERCGGGDDEEGALMVEVRGGRDWGMMGGSDWGTMVMTVEIKGCCCLES
ncbi:hypothetical protein F0562_025429 [Nyssa sinensis]|uniref:Uncharacterized protein n=1 Tax=Nyssa sinensis TaxID=561372 RepID=A0A5J5BFP3_9ASTE|nr:hypothetical protein F0562_025429 [Nyssa sinensis]